MGVLNNIVGTAIGSNTGTGLQDFLSKFSASDSKLVNQINPLATFEVSFAFEPTEGTESDTGILAKIGTALGTAVTGAVKNAVNNVTGGLAGSLVNDIFGQSIKEQHDTFKDAGKHTFIEYLAKANMLVGGENFFKPNQGLCPIELQMGFYVQDITVPKLKLLGENKTTSGLLGEFPINGYMIQPDNFNLQMNILNTKLPLIERIFYPWMREVTLPYWSYETQPYTTATITIDFSKHMDIQYVFYGCRPSQIDTVQPTQELNNVIARQVTFLFDFMIITSKNMPVMESTIDKLLGAAGTITNGAANMLNL